MTAFARYPSLEGRTVVVTGGATGIGEALVRAFAANGARVAFLDIQKAQGEALASDIAKSGAPAPLFLPCDLLDIEALRRVLATASKQLGPASVLVNNAAEDRRAKFEDITPAEFDRMIGINFKHVFFAAQTVAPEMRELGGGSIINFTSGTWVRGVPDLELYGAAKAAIVGLTNILARDLGSTRIRVNAIMPGLVLTEKQRRMWFSQPGSADLFIAQQCIPDPVAPDDVARLALFLAADDSKSITKQVMAVNGGIN